MINAEDRVRVVLDCRDYYVIDLKRIDNKNKVKELIIECDMVVDKVDMSQIGVYNDFETLVSKIFEKESYKESPIVLWLRIFDLYLHEFKDFREGSIEEAIEKGEYWNKVEEHLIYQINIKTFLLGNF